MTDGEQPAPGQIPLPAETPDTGLTETGHDPGGGGDTGPKDESDGGRHRPGGGRRARWYALAKAGYIEYDRVLFFSDAVFAIAITLLAIDLRVPAAALSGPTSLRASTELSKTTSSLIGFGISFAVIGLFWLGHHGMFRYIVALDRPLIALNLFFLGTIAFLPYPTEVLSANFADRRVAVIFYAGCAALAGMAEGAIWLRASSRPALVDPSAESIRLLMTLRIARVPVIFLLSIPVAIVAPHVAPDLWVLVWISGVAINRLVPPRSPATTS